MYSYFDSKGAPVYLDRYGMSGEIVTEWGKKKKFPHLTTSRIPLRTHIFVSGQGLFIGEKEVL